MLEITEWTVNHPFQTIELDRESRKYIHVSINNI